MLIRIRVQNDSIRSHYGAFFGDRVVHDRALPQNILSPLAGGLKNFREIDFYRRLKLCVVHGEFELLEGQITLRPQQTRFKILNGIRSRPL